MHFQSYSLLPEFALLEAAGTGPLPDEFDPDDEDEGSNAVVEMLLESLLLSDLPSDALSASAEGAAFLPDLA